MPGAVTNHSKDARESCPLLRLPREILDEVISGIDLHRDLTSFAYTSKACAGLVIPRHTEYRIIRMRYILPSMWAHLARRSDLARNIREIHLCERKDYSAPDHFPMLLIDGVQDADPLNTQTWQVIQNMAAALRHMRKLRVFTWAWDMSLTADPKTKMVYEHEVFSVLMELPLLAHLGVFGRFALVSSLGEQQVQRYPLWKASNLTSLCLVGDAWSNITNAPHIRAMLGASSSLECLDLPMEFPMFSGCSLPNLKRLRLQLQSGTNPTNSLLANKGKPAYVEFLEKHPHIEELNWTPVGFEPLSPESLPNLKSLQTTDEVLHILSKAEAPRQIERLTVHLLDSVIVEALKVVDKDALRKLSIRHYANTEVLHVVAEMFSNITWLSLPDGFQTVDDLAGWLDLLSRFRQLEVFRGQGIWQAVNMDKCRMHQAIFDLVETCPKLREIDHCDYDIKRCAFKRIVIFREKLEDTVHVRYEVKKPSPRQRFDISDGCFD